MTRAPTSEANDKRREAIINTAAKLFSEQGFIETTLAQIMGELGVSGAAYYYYYDSKQEVLAEILDRALRRVEQELETISRSTDLTATQKLGMVIRAHALAVAQNSSVASVLFNEMGRAESGYARNIRSRMRQYTGHLIELYKYGVARGELVDENPTLAINCLLGQANWISQWYSSNPVVEPETVADVVGRAAIRAFARDRAVELPVPPPPVKPGS